MTFRPVVALVVAALLALVGVGRPTVGSVGRSGPAGAARPPASRSGMQVLEFASVAPTADARDPLVAGAVLDFTWAEIEPARGRYRWDRIDDEIRPWAAAGKTVVLRVAASTETGWGEGPGTPAWVYAAGVGHVTEPDGSTIPVYWDPTFVRLYGAFVAAFGRVFGADRSVRLVEMGIGMGAETIVDQEDDLPATRLALWLAAGYTDRRWLGAVETFAGDYRTAFPRTPLAALVDSSFLVDQPPWYLRMLTWLESRRFVLQWDGLTTQTSASPFPDGVDPAVVEQLAPVSKTPGQDLAAELRIARTVLRARLFLLYASDLPLYQRTLRP